MFQNQDFINNCIHLEVSYEQPVPSCDMLYVKGNIKGKAEVITFFLLQRNNEGNIDIVRSIQVDPSKESKDALFTGLNKGNYHVVLVAGLGPGIKEITPEQYLKAKLNGETLALKSDVCYKSYPVKKESV